ncbi:hypothetical protein PBI_RHYNO_58 [Mycobacterium phage RhynO]|nr:hypothetical protein CG97_gp24 [Mycobacterium phage RhynO]AHJ88716.1 hypothetical protein PBI_RHYNO_58 [Mycobacterium phage RhynO]QLF84453.1 hypothetical protein SEA_TOPANGA_55 [Mycobacterium phage Topanga]
MRYRVEAIIRSDEDEGKFAEQFDELIHDTYKTGVEDTVVYAING